MGFPLTAGVALAHANGWDEAVLLLVGLLLTVLVLRSVRKSKKGGGRRTR